MRARKTRRETHKVLRVHESLRDLAEVGRAPGRSRVSFILSFLRHRCRRPAPSLPVFLSHPPILFLFLRGE